MYNKILYCLRRVDLALRKEKDLEFIKHCFVFGSVSKCCVHSESDIDLLIIGTEPKSISLISSINKILDKYNDSGIELDVKYYEISVFRSLRDSNVFLKSIEKDCIRLEDCFSELLRFCT